MTKISMTLGGAAPSGAMAQSLLDQARADAEVATAILLAAACIEAAEAFGADDEADPAVALERLLAGFRTAARSALAVIIQREGAAA